MLKRFAKLSAAGISCAFSISAHDASAACSKTSFLSAQSPATGRYTDRFNTLLAQDPFLVTGQAASGWKTLVDDLKRDEHAPPELVARSEMILAASLGGDDTVASSLALAQDARARAEAGGTTSGSLHAALLTTLAVKQAVAGKSDEALATADAALAETERADGTDGWSYGYAALNAAATHHASGDHVGAEQLAAISERLAIACLPPDLSIIGAVIQRHAATLDALGRTDEALVEGERALSWDLAHLRESDVALAEALEAVGFTLFNANRLREAEAVMRRAVDLHARYRPDDPAWRAPVTGKLGRILAAEGKYREAEAMFLAAQDLYGRAHDLTNPLAGSGEVRRAADMAQAQGRLDEALDLRRRALALMEGRVSPKHPELARARIEYATTLTIAGRARDALAIARPSVALLRGAAPPGDPKRMNGEIAYALVAAAAGLDPTTTYSEAAPVLARMEALMLGGEASRSDLANLAPSFAHSFAAGARLALAAHHKEAAFHALQLANLSDVVLANADVMARAAAADPQVRALIERRGANLRDRQRLDQERVAAGARGDTAAVMTLDVAIRRDDEASAAMTRKLDRTFPAYRSLREPRPITLATLRAQLASDEVVLAPLMLARETLVVMVAREGLRWTSVAASGAQVAAMVATLRDAIDAGRRDPGRRFDTAASRRLAAVLLPPALATPFDAHHHLVYYASGTLATVSPALLVTEPVRPGATPAWLIRSHDVSIATTLAPRTNRDRHTRDSFLGVGAPTSGDTPLTDAIATTKGKFGEFGQVPIAPLPPLPDATRELQTMARLFPAAQQTLLIGAAATKSAFNALSLNHYGIIAFATHALVANALPGQSQAALVMTPASGNGASNDGLLTTVEIAGLHLNADWVILSACSTAGPADGQGESYSGLASAFIEAGARALLVSQWPVRDDAAARITVATLAATRRGIDRPDALRRAMLSLMRDRRMPGAAHPAIWAPFVLVER